MNGGLFKSASRFALVAAAGIVSGGIAAQAADLGGNCCADLEERVAELEATSARKGNRKVSLTVSGHVNEAIIFWDDGKEQNAYVVSNENSRTRFRFVGDAKISADWSAGYLLEISAGYAISATRNQLAANSGGNTNTLAIRHSAWWLDNKQLGRVWVGATSSATDGITEINLANVVTSNNDSSNWNGGFLLRNKNGTLATGLTWSSIRSHSFNTGEGGRNNVVKYVSPTFAGFTFSAAAGEDDMWDTALRYAGEFNGIRIAAGVGYKQNYGITGSTNGNCNNTNGAGVINATESSVDCNTIGLSASVMHVPTGIYAMGSWGRLEDKNRQTFVTTAKDNDQHWFVQAGIEQNWFAIGKTTVYGQYLEAENGMSLATGARVSSTPLTGGGGLFISDARVTEWGFGVNQQISAAAMDIYLAYQHTDAEVRASATGGQAGAVKLPGVKEWDAIMAGAIIRF